MNYAERKAEIKRLADERPIKKDTAAKILDLLVWRKFK